VSDAEQVRPAVKPGEIIAGKYRVEGTLGSGGMAVVLSATQLDLDRLVAIKVMRAELTQVPGAVQRLLLEAKLTARFRSEHICKVLDVGTLMNGAPYVVMEYLDGTDLNGLLAERGRFDVVSAVDLILQACEGIAEAHAAAIIHRDLKPENLFVTNLLDDPPTVKILDFGISKQLGARPIGRVLTNPSAALGSPYYMAPEQMHSAKDADLRVDVWAIGAILFELLTGQPPFDGDTLPEVCAKVMRSDPKRAQELCPDVPTLLSNAVGRCLEKDPNQRFSSIAELAGALAPFGSFRAAASLKRIERVLAQSPALSDVVNVDPELVTLIGGEPNDTFHDVRQIDLKSAGTTGAASSMVSSPTQRGGSTWKLLAAAAVLCVAGAGVIFANFAGGIGHATRAEPPLRAGGGTTSEPHAISLVRPANAAPSATSDLHESSLPIDPALSASAPALPTVKAPARAHRATHAGKRSTPEPTAAPPVPSSEQKKTTNNKATEAWDPATFGPRR
jgi:eukaryotic-like serine/threonine-protein kinase